jgi:hypothetical protein
MVERDDVSEGALTLTKVTSQGREEPLFDHKTMKVLSSTAAKLESGVIETQANLQHLQKKQMQRRRRASIAESQATSAQLARRESARESAATADNSSSKVTGPPAEEVMPMTIRRVSSEHQMRPKDILTQSNANVQNSSSNIEIFDKSKLQALLTEFQNSAANRERGMTVVKKLNTDTLKKVANSINVTDKNSNASVPPKLSNTLYCDVRYNFVQNAHC